MKNYLSIAGWAGVIRVLPGLLLLLEGRAAADDWPQWMGPQRDGVWRESGVLRAFPPGGPKVRWRTAIGGGYAGPAVALGRVYVTDRRLAPGGAQPADPFARGRIPGTERVLCLEERDGRLLWQHEYEVAYTVSYAGGPRTTPLVHQGKVYTLGAEGHLRCLDTRAGSLLWARDFNRDYEAKTPVWGFAGHPLLDGNKLICLVGGPGSVVVAFDTESGRELWRGLTAKEPGYAPPVIYEFGGRRHLVVWHPEAVSALDPETGRLLWTHPWAIRSGLSVSMPRQDADRLFLTAFYNGSLLLRVKPEGAETVWQSRKVSEKDTDALHSIIPTPFLVDGHIYGVCSYGQLRCLKAETGERVWETFEATTGQAVRWGNAFLVRHEDRWFLFNEQGDLILARLTPERYQELGRVHLLDPTNEDPRRPVVWSHPAFAQRSVYARNDREIVCLSLAAE